MRQLVARFWLVTVFEFLGFRRLPACLLTSESYIVISTEMAGYHGPVKIAPFSELGLAPDRKMAEQRVLYREWPDLGFPGLLTESESGENSLVGMGSVGELLMGLEVDDLRFDEKCRARSLDPDAVRAQLESE